MHRQGHLPILNNHSPDYCQNVFREGTISSVLSCTSAYLIAAVKDSIREYFQRNFVDILYAALGIFTYFYLAISIVAFFFQGHVSLALLYVVDALAQPYLGALGVYVVVKEIARHHDHLTNRRRWGEHFVTIWIIFFIAASFAIYYSDSYYLNEMYKTIATNSLAVLIIRIGAFLK